MVLWGEVFVSLGIEVLIGNFFVARGVVKVLSDVYTYSIHTLYAWISIRMWSISCSSEVLDFISSFIFSHEWITVVWSLPPSFSPIEGYDTLNSSRRTYMIICRGFTTSFLRVFS